MKTRTKIKHIRKDINKRRWRQSLFERQYHRYRIKKQTTCFSFCELCYSVARTLRNNPNNKKCLVKLKIALELYIQSQIQNDCNSCGDYVYYPLETFETVEDLEYKISYCADRWNISRARDVLAGVIKFIEVCDEK